MTCAHSNSGAAMRPLAAACILALLAPQPIWGQGSKVEPDKTQPETFQAAFTVSSSGKEVKASCAVCHNLTIKVGDRTLESGEAGTFRKGKAYDVRVIDQLETWRPAGSTPPDETTATFTAWPVEVDGQIISKSDDDKAFTVTKGQILQYLIDNSEQLLAQDKPWDKARLQKKARLLPVEIKEVSFGATDPAKHHNVMSDDGQTLYQAPQWQDNSTPRDGDVTDDGDHKYPVAFVRGATIKASAAFVIPAGFSQMSIQVKGDGPGSYDFPATTASATTSGSETTIQVSDIACSTALENKVDIFDPFEVEWSLSFDGGQTWSAIGKTQTQVYATLETPLTTRTDLFHTMLHIGCTGAKETTDSNAAIAGIWSEFEDRSVKRVDKTLLTYWKNWSELLVTGNRAELLLADADGQCSSWADLLIKTVWALGIDPPNTNRVVVENYAGAENVILIKNWQFTNPETEGNSDGSSQYLNYAVSFNELLKNNQYSWLFAPENVRDSAGIEGQGNLDPLSLFTGHVIAKIEGKLYDPSYGRAYNDQYAIEHESIAGYAYVKPTTVDETITGTDLNGDGQVQSDAPILIFFMREQPGSVGNILLRDIQNGIGN